LIISSSGIHW